MSTKVNGNLNAACVAAVRVALAEELDWRIAADQLLAAMPSDAKTLRMWLNYALPQAVRTEATRVRMEEIQRIVEFDNRSPDRLIVRIPIDGMGKRLWRSSSIADCTREDLVSVQELYKRKAAENQARADAIGRLIDALDRFEADVVSDLPDDEIRSAFAGRDIGAEVVPV